MHHKKKGAPRLGYLTHYVVDGGKARVILNALVTPAEVTENLPMLELLFRSRFLWRLRPRSVTGDAAYGTTENVVAVEKAAYGHTWCYPTTTNAVPSSARTTSSTTPKATPIRALKVRLCADKAATTRRDPPGMPLGPMPATPALSGLDARRARRRDVGSGAASMRRPPKGAKYGDTEAYRKALRKRQVWVEPLFAEALLIAAGQNIKRLLTYAYRGPRREAQVIALRHPTSKPYEFCSVRKHLKRCAWRPPRVFQHPEVFSETPLLDENTKA